MATLHVKAPDGKTLNVNVPEGTDSSQYDAMADEAVRHYSSTLSKPSVLETAAENVVKKPLDMVKQMATMSPNAQKVAASAMPIFGGAVGTPFGLGVPGAALGEFGRQAVNTVIDPEANPQTALGRAASVVGAGVLQEPSVLKAIPGVPQVSEMVGNLASKTGKGMSKLKQAFSGARAADFDEASKNGLMTYAAPSMEEAKGIYAKALNKLPGEQVEQTFVEKMSNALTPEKSAANKYLEEIAAKIDAGEAIDARQALKAKQSLDDVIDTVPFWQKKKRGFLFDTKRKFDEILSTQSGDMKKASNTYRAAVLKDNMTKPFPVNKHGEYSRLAGMLSTLGGSVGGTIGGRESGAKGGVIGALAPLAGAVALSPFSLGAATTASSEFGKLVARPEVRQALMQILQRMRSNENNR